MRAFFIVVTAFVASTSVAQAADTASSSRNNSSTHSSDSGSGIHPSADDKVVAGVGLVFGTEPSTLGLQGSVYVPIAAAKGLRIGGDAVIYLPFSEGTVDLFWFSLNPGVQFVFDVGAPIHPYIEGGLAIVFVHASLPGDVSDSNTELGLNLGGGAEYELSFARVYGALRFQFLGDSRDQAELIGGLRWAF